MRREAHRKDQVRQPHVAGADDDSYAFRRSRTITGSTAEAVRSATESRAQLKSPRLHEHSLRKHRRKLGSYLFVSLIAAGLLWYMIASYIGNQLIVVTPADQATHSRLDVERYRNISNEYFAGHPFERLSFTLDENAFSEYVRTKAPEIAQAEIDKTGSPGDATLLVTLREPVVGWTIKGQQYFVDADGGAFTKNYFAAPTVVVTDKSGITAQSGVVVSQKQLRFIGRVISLTNASGAGVVESVELPPNSTRQVDIKLKDRNYIIKTNVDRDPAGQAADIVNTLRYIDAKGIVPAYLDIRVSSKAFYR